jgi:hypothetical protein
MKEKFANAIVVCAAIVAFTGGSGAILNGIDSILIARMDSFLVNKETARQAALAAESDGGSVDALVTGVKKAVKTLVR